MPGTQEAESQTRVPPKSRRKPEKDVRQWTQQCAGRALQPLWKPWYAAHFWAVNTPTMADFKLPSSRAGKKCSQLALLNQPKIHWPAGNLSGFCSPGASRNPKCNISHLIFATYILIIINSTICGLILHVGGGGKGHLASTLPASQSVNPKEDVSGRLEKLPKVMENIWAGRER